MKKGFTMIEVMAVFTIAVIILIIAIPQMTSLLKKSNEQQMESFKKSLYLATESYIEGENIELGEGIYTIKIKDMILNNYLNSTITYPVTNKKFSKMTDQELDKLVIRVSKDEEGYYKYEFVDLTLTN